jgi:hypothetical protein
VAAGGSVVVLVAFFALPAISLGFLGSLTGAQITSLSGDVSSDGTSLAWTVGFWLVPVFAVVSIVLCAWIASSASASRGSTRTAASVVATYGIAAGILLLLALIALTEEGLGFALSGGAWLMLLGLVAVATGGIAENRMATRRVV